MASQTLTIPGTRTKKVGTKISGTPKLQSKKKEAAKDLSKTYVDAIGEEIALWNE